MHFINIHRRIIQQPSEKIAVLLETLATKNDQVLANNKWPAMRLNNGLQAGSSGGHGPIGYTVQTHRPGELIQFEFTKPKGFVGIHRFEITALGGNRSEIKHTIDMKASGLAALQWILAIRWLHDAFIEDAFDKVENHFLGEPKRTEWSAWVKILRRILR